MNLSGIFSDDQIGILGSLLALGVCGLIMALSFRFGPSGQQSSQNSVVPMQNRKPQSDVKSDRKAA